MRAKNIIIILFVVLFGQCNIYGQGILAGDTISPGIIYINIPDFSVSASYPSGYECETLDLDGDGTDDLKFCSSKESTMGTSFESTRAIGLNGAEIASYPSNVYWLNSFEFNSMINGSDTWGDDGIFKSEEHFPDTSYYAGVFSNGYMGFRLYQGLDTIYGWVKITASSGHVTVYEYAAYQPNLAGIDQRSLLTEVKVYPNPCTDVTHLRFTFHDSRFTTIDLYSISGMKIRELVNEVKMPGAYELNIDVSQLPAGVYFIRIQAGKELVVRKLIVSN
ncbi:MAG: T9SS type A sorting domain-containing protein [Bacteroidota bacterium]|nr:T9SS type A sorting domain-containing protein [Bacteroidota bacterium]